MKCKKCGIDLPDLTMYCPECGTPQFEASKPEIQLTGAVSKSKVVIIGINNMTEAVQYLRGTTGQSMPEVMKMLKTLPLDYAVGLTEEKANEMVKGMSDNGLNAVAVHPEAPKPAAPAPQPAAPVIEEPREEAAAIEETPAVEEPAVIEEPAPAEEIPAEEKPSFEEEMAAFMAEPAAEPVVEEAAAVEEPAPAEEAPEEEKPSFEEEMAAFMAEPAEEPVVEETAAAEEPAPAEEAPAAEDAAAEEEATESEGLDGASASFAQSSEAFLDLQDDEPKEEYVPQLTLDPNHETDDAFMKEMEEFLKS